MKSDKWKLMPYQATDEMLKEMDECSTEGYDERLYAGHASSVYSAAWDAFQAQQAEPVAMRYDFDGYGYKYIDNGSGSDWQTRIQDAEPVFAQPQEPVIDKSAAIRIATALGWTPPRQPLTDEEIDKLRDVNSEGRGRGFRFDFKAFARAIEAKLKEKNT